MMPLPHRLDRTVTIQATRETVFRFFTDDARWAAWWGAGSTIDARPGGHILIRYPNGVEASGEVLEVIPPERIVFTYGYASKQPIPPGSSRVTIRLEPYEAGTRLSLSHEFAEAAGRDEHVQGWRYQLSVFGNVVADEIHAGAAGLVDAWFQAWSATDVGKREQILVPVVAPDVRFRDRFGLIDGLADLIAHVDAVQRFMPGVRLQRRGDIRHCQGTVLADWVVVGGDGQERESGTNVFVLGADGRVESVIGFWNART
jgi:uncharacterized protein YndB with AHSA1/START domain